MRVGTDTGGTFTDLVRADGTVAKVPSTPDDPGRALRHGLRQLDDGDPLERLTHGTTVATNALLERRGATVALVTNAGMADIIEIGRQDRPSLYDQTVDRPEPLVARAHRYEVAGRLDAAGAELEPVEPERLAGLDPTVEAVAVVLLHADLNPVHERAVAEQLARRGHDVSASHQVSPEFREYERTVTTVANAYLRPACRGYLEGLAGLAEQVGIMTSAGGVVAVGTAVDRPVDLVLSGPAGGVTAGAAVAMANGWPDAVTFDMGGTSTDVCLVLGGQAAAGAERVVGGFALRVASLDVHTIGAGGGSVAALDAGGALTVGPRSAGAVPGPACYGLGGAEPTVTDADLVAGRLPEGIALPGLGVLDVAAARAALAAAGVDAAGVIAVVEAAMNQAVRAVTVERGVDPRGLALVAFGGAGPLHACGLAEALGMPAVLVPARAGVLSAVGILAADDQRDLVRSWPTPGDHRGLDQAAAELGRAARRALGSGSGSGDTDVVVETAVDCRYRGQSYELTVPTVAEFTAEHQLRNGYGSPDQPVEVVAVRARARRRAPVALADLPAPPRPSAVGRAVIAEPDCTIWVPEGWRADPGAAGALVLTRVGGAEQSRSEDVRRQMPKEPVGRLDPASLQILISRLSGVAEEMSAVLRRAAYSPNIKERADCSAAVFDPQGRLLAQAENIPVHLGSMPASVGAVIERFGHEVEPGLQAIVNDPYAGGTHLNDITVVAPAYTGDGHLVGWVATRAHHADVGGDAPGSMPADATDIAQEGLRLAPTRLTADVRELVIRTSRTPLERAGDLDAQVGANAVGAERLAALAGQPFDQVLAHGERRLRSVVAGLADGTWRFTDVIDSFGSRAEQQQPSVIHLAVTVAGDELTFDFTGSQAQRMGNVNAVEAVTVSAVAFAVRAASDPTLPANAGTLRPGARGGTGWLHRQRPATGGGGGGQRGGEPAGGRRVLRGPGPDPARAGRGRLAGHHEQRAGGQRPVGLLRDPGRWAGRPARRSRHERGAHPHDQHPQHAHRGAGAVIPGAGATPAPAAGQRRCRAPSGRRGDRARPRGAGGGHLVVDHRAAHVAAMGPGGRPAGGGGGELAAPRRRRVPGSAAGGQVHGRVGPRRRGAHPDPRWRRVGRAAAGLTNLTARSGFDGARAVCLGSRPWKSTGSQPSSPGARRASVRRWPANWPAAAPRWSSPTSRTTRATPWPLRSVGPSPTWTWAIPTT